MSIKINARETNVKIGKTPGVLLRLFLQVLKLLETKKR